MKFLGLIFICFIVFFQSIYSDDKTIVAAYCEYPPYMSSNNPVGGVLLEIVRAAYKTQDYSVEIEYLSWARALDGVIKGIYDIAPGAWFDDSREDQMLFSVPFFKGNIKFISSAYDKYDINDINDLSGKDVGLIRGYAYSQDIEDAKHFTKFLSSDFIQNIHRLINGRIDLTIEDELVAKTSLIQEDPALLEQIYFSKNSYITNNFYVTCSYVNPRHKEFINAFNRGFEEIKANGVYNEIIKKYGLE